jgi:hypothetical protein
MATLTTLLERVLLFIGMSVKAHVSVGGIISSLRTLQGTGSYTGYRITPAKKRRSVMQRFQFLEQNALKILFLHGQGLRC